MRINDEICPEEITFKYQGGHVNMSYNKQLGLNSYGIMGVGH